MKALENVKLMAFPFLSAPNRACARWQSGRRSAAGCPNMDQSETLRHGRARKRDGCGDMSSMKNIIMALKFYFSFAPFDLFSLLPPPFARPDPGWKCAAPTVCASMCAQHRHRSETQNGDEIERSVVGWFLCTFDRARNDYPVLLEVVKSTFRCIWQSQSFKTKSKWHSQSSWSAKALIVSNFCLRLFASWVLFLVFDFGIWMWKVRSLREQLTNTAAAPASKINAFCIGRFMICHLSLFDR